jgi:ATP-dependent helicase STH1/SNF2
MQLEELPECYQTDEPFKPKEIDDAIQGHGQCHHNVINYNNGLSNEQWAMVCLVGCQDACMLIEMLGCGGW